MCEYCEKRKYILNEKKERLSISKSTFGYYLHYVNNMYIKNLGFIKYCPICRQKVRWRIMLDAIIAIILLFVGIGTGEANWFIASGIFEIASVLSFWREDKQ